MQVSLRDFHPDDFQTLWRIDQQCFAPGIAYSRMELAAYVRRKSGFTLVAESETGQRAIVGFIVADAPKGRSGHIITIDVLPEVRRAGVGSKLLLSSEARLRTSACSQVTLETAVDNRGALSFYKRHGYDVVGSIPHYYSNGLDALVLRKDLLSLSGTDNVQP